VEKKKQGPNRYECAAKKIMKLRELRTGKSSKLNTYETKS